MCRFFKTNKNTFSIDFANIIYFFILQISFTFFTRYRLNIFFVFSKKIFFLHFQSQLQKSPRHLPKKHRGENLGIKNSNKTDVSFFADNNLPITLARLSLRENFVSLEFYRTRHILNWLAVVEKNFESVARFEGSKFEFGADEIHWT